MVLLLIFAYVPMVGVVLAFKDYSIADGILASPWVGLQHFIKLFASDEFLRVTRNTLVISLLRLIFGFFAPVVIALLLHDVRVSWYRRGVQTLTIMPYFFSWVILGGIFLMLLSSNGPVNQIAALATHKPIEFLTNRAWFIAVLVVTGIWQGAGYGAVIYLAALSGINPDLYEAAVLDGASRWRQTLHITLPCLAPTMVTLLILSLGGILSAGFDQIYNMYNPMVYQSSDIIDTYVLRHMRLMDFGLATAAGLFKSMVGLILIVVVNSVAKRASGGEQGIW